MPQRRAAQLRRDPGAAIRGQHQPVPHVTQKPPNPMPLQHPGDTTLPTAELAELLIYAFRYSLGRRTYVVSDMCRSLRCHWAALPCAWQEIIHREIREAIDREGAGDACDVADWRGLLELPVAPQITK